MKYFTDQLWSDMNDEDEQIRKHAETKWEDNSKAYWARFGQSVRERLPKRVSQCHSAVGFHDSELIKIDISQGAQRAKYHVTVTIHLLLQGGKWIIQYKNVSKISFDYFTDGGTMSGLDDWGYDEFLDVDEKLLSHEILFASGTTLLIHFPDKNVSIKKLTPSL